MRVVVTSVIALAYWVGVFMPYPVFFGGALWPVVLGMAVLVLVPLSVLSYHVGGREPRTVSGTIAPTAHPHPTAA
jgi:hypothetical protein